MTDRIRDLIDGLDNVRIALLKEVGGAQYGPHDRVEFTPDETKELVHWIIKAEDFLGELDEHKFKDTNRHLVEVPDSFAVARWARGADVTTIARCILGTLRYEPHAADTTPLRRALETLVEHEVATAHKFAEAR
jgi:hypothetical protein